MGPIHIFRNGKELHVYPYTQRYQHGYIDVYEEDNPDPVITFLLSKIVNKQLDQQEASS